MSKVIINTLGVMGHETEVIFVADDGQEIDISAITTGVDLGIKVGEPNRATLSMVKVEGRLEADLVDVCVESIKPRRGRRRVPREISALGDSISKWVNA